MIKIKFCLLLMAVATNCSSQPDSHNIKSYGAKADGKTLNTAAIQRAIDAVAKSGGGTVVVPAGRFVTGVITLKSNVALHMENGAILLGSTDRARYGPSEKASALLVAVGAKNISITGPGTIDGQCDSLINDIYKKLVAGELYDREWKQYNDWHQRRPAENNRPRMIEFTGCDGVTIKKLRLQNGTSWVQAYRNCSNVTVDSITVLSNTFLNNDGIDIVDCNNVKITNSDFNCADDGICLKSEDRSRLCENIYVANCKVRSSASAVKFGTASRGGFKNVAIENIEVYNTFRSAIAIEAVDGGALENILVRHIRARNTGNAIFVKLGHRNKDSVVSKLKNVLISDVIVGVPSTKPDKGYTMDGPELREPSKVEDTTVYYPQGAPWYHFSVDTTAALIPHNVFPSSVSGIPGHPVENVVLQNITIIYEDGGDSSRAYFPLHSFNKIPEFESAYPEFSMFGELPVWGLFIRHVNGIVLQNINLQNKKSDYRTALLADDVKNIGIRDINIKGVSSAPALFFNKADALSLENIGMPDKKGEGPNDNAGRKRK